MDEFMPEPVGSVCSAGHESPGNSNIAGAHKQHGEAFEWSKVISDSGVSVARITIPRSQIAVKQCRINAKRIHQQKQHPQKMMVIKPASEKISKLRWKKPTCVKSAPKKEFLFKIVQKSNSKVLEGAAGDPKCTPCQVVEERLNLGSDCKQEEKIQTTKVCYKCPFNYECNLHLGKCDERTQSHSDPNQRSRWQYVCPVCFLNCDEVCSSVPHLWNHLKDHPCFLKYCVQCACANSNRNDRWAGDHDRNLDLYMEHLQQCHAEDSAVGNVLFEVLLDPLILAKMVGKCEKFYSLTEFFIHLKTHLHVREIGLLCRHCIQKNHHDEPSGNPQFLKENLFLEHLTTTHSIEDNAEPVLISIQLSMHSKPEMELDDPESEMTSWRQVSQSADFSASVVDRTWKSNSILRCVTENHPSWVLPYIVCPCLEYGCSFITRDLLLLGQHIEKHLHPMGMRWMAVCRLCFALLPGMVHGAHHILSRHSTFGSGVICQAVMQCPEESLSLMNQSSSMPLKELLNRRYAVQEVVSSAHSTVYQSSDIFLRYIQAAGHHVQDNSQVSDGTPVATLSRLGMIVVVRPEIQQLGDCEWRFWVGSGSKQKMFPAPELLREKLRQSGNASLLFASEVTQTDMCTSRQRGPDMQSAAAESGQCVSSQKLWNEEYGPAKQQFQEKVDYQDPKSKNWPNEHSTNHGDKNGTAGQPEGNWSVQDAQEVELETWKKMRRLSKELAVQRLQEKINYLTRTYLEPSREDRAVPNAFCEERTVSGASETLQESSPCSKEKEKSPTKANQWKLKAYGHTAQQEAAGPPSKLEDDSHMELFMALAKAQSRCGVRCMFQANGSFLAYQRRGEVEDAGQPPLAPVVVNSPVLQMQAQKSQAAVNHCPDHNNTLHAELELAVVGTGMNVFLKECVLMKEMATDVVFQCPYCLFTRLRMPDVARHLAVMHDAEEIAAMKSVNQAVYFPITKFTLLYCRFCSFVTPYLLSMWRHFQNIHQFRMPLSSSETSSCLSSQEGLTCCSCDFATPVHATMIHHIKENHAEDLGVLKLGYVICYANVQPVDTVAGTSGLKLVPQQSLAAPARMAVLAFLCQFCEGRFSSVRLVESHCLEAHGRGMLFFCFECKFTFEDMSLVSEHMAIHGCNRCSVGMTVANKRHIYLVNDTKSEARGYDPLVPDDPMEDSEDQCVMTIGGQELCLPMSWLHEDLQRHLHNGNQLAWMAMLRVSPDAV